MGQVTECWGPERRRRWSEEERLQILSGAFAPGACVAEVCRRHDISSALNYTWRRKLLDAGAAQETEVPDALPAPVFAEAVLDARCLDSGRLVWPSASEGTVSLTPSQLACLLEGVDWRNPQDTWRLRRAR